MTLNISNALKNFGEVYDFNLLIDLPNQFMYGEEIVFNSSCISGNYGMVDDGIFVSGHLDTELMGHCSRCLKAVKSNLSFDFSEIFVDFNKSQTSKQDEIIYYYKNSEIDLLPLILENLIPKIPMKFECEDNCINSAIFNQDVSNRYSNPFDILKEFFKNDEEV